MMDFITIIRCDKEACTNVICMLRGLENCAIDLDTHLLYLPLEAFLMLVIFYNLYICKVICKLFICKYCYAIEILL